MHESSPVPYESRWMVWTSHDVRQTFSRSNEAIWFWAASGARGHMNGAESTSQAATDRAHAAYVSLMGTHELNPPKRKDGQ